MSQVVNMHVAKTNLSRLVDVAASGQEVVIARAGRPVARLVALRETGAARRPGALAGRIHIAEDFDATPDWLTDTFEGADPNHG